METPTTDRLPALEALRVNVIIGRARARLSQEELANRAGISRPTVSRIERAAADVGIEIVQRIADALGIAVADLFLPTRDDRVDNDELAARAVAPDSEFIDARAVLDAVDEAAGRPIERYSRAGRPPVAR
ncbi:MAG: helix-turn-helix transcriptional regulator [Vulcanimicrobiaceae bacterium]